MILPRQEYFTPFPPEELWADEHNMRFPNGMKDTILAWCDDHAGERGKDYWYPAAGIIVFRDTRLRALFKLTWGGCLKLS